MVVIQEIITGRTCSLFAIAGEDDCPVQDFLNKLMEDDRNEFEKITRLLNYTAENGPPNNEEKCRYFKELKVFELKTGGGVRIMAFWDKDHLIICSHGFMKKGQKTPKQDKKRVSNARKNYFEAKQLNAVQIKI